jgi:uncharacterized protein YycO
MDLESAIVKAVSKVSIPERHIKNGDCLVSRTDWELSNFFEYALTGSFYGHAAIYFDGYVYEAVTSGVRKISLERFLFTKDAIGLCRLPGPDWTVNQCIMMKSFLDAQIGEAYDYGFSWTAQDRWYCSKLVFSAWHEADPKDADAIRTKRILGETKIIPQDVWDSSVKIVDVRRHK